MKDEILAIIKRRPPMLLVIPLLYLVAVCLVKWQLTPRPGMFLFLLGGAMGLFFMDAAEVFFKLNPSPFRSVLFAAGLALISTFLVTSSESFVAVGLVLTLSLNLLLWQVGEWQVHQQLHSWYRMIAVPVRPEVQRLITAGFVLLFCVHTLLFLAGGMR